MNKLLGINIIGDIHGRDSWKELVDLNFLNVFVGDYFDPYGIILYDDLVKNFLEIIELKRNNPDKVILLIGNHDAHYLPEYGLNESTRFNHFKAPEITKLFQDNADCFYGVVYYDKETDLIISHAGITKEWYNKYINKTDDSPEIVESNINNLWNTNKSCFTFMKNQGSPTDCYGEYASHSPLWVRTYALMEDNYFKDTNTIQVIGHTQTYTIIESKGLVDVDVLGTNIESFKKIYL